MSRRRKIWSTVVACCLLMAAALMWPRLPRVASKALDGAEQYTLLSIDPRRPEQLVGDEFHGFRVLGQTSVTAPAVRTRLNRALNRGVDPLSTRYRCFNPRHGIRVKLMPHDSYFMKPLTATLESAFGKSSIPPV